MSRVRSHRGHFFHARGCRNRTRRTLARYALSNRWRSKDLGPGFLPKYLGAFAVFSLSLLHRFREMRRMGISASVNRGLLVVVVFSSALFCKRAARGHQQDARMLRSASARLKARVAAKCARIGAGHAGCAHAAFWYLMHSIRRHSRWRTGKHQT